MLQTVEAIVDESGDTDAIVSPETALLSESALATEWNRPEEDAAWSHLPRVS